MPSVDRVRTVFVLGIIFVLIASNATSQKGVSAEPGAGTPMRQLLDTFRSSTPPSPPELVGRWVVIRTVSTEAFLTGKDGDDHTSFDESGIRRADREGKPLEWTLEFQRGEVEDLVLLSSPVWSAASKQPIEMEPGSELVIDAHFDGDANAFYRCRSSKASTLVCLLKNHEWGNGVEFRKVAD